VNEGTALFAADAPAAGNETWAFLCECGAAECAAWVELDLDEYAARRKACAAAEQVSVPLKPAASIALTRESEDDRWSAARG
jgi:hypothetical protein